METIPIFSGKWRDYFSVPDSYGDDKPLLEWALDDIAATGKDGADLLMKAYASAKANKAAGQAMSIAIRQSMGINSPVAAGDKIEFHSQGSVSAMQNADIGSHVGALASGIIYIDPKQARKLAYKDILGIPYNASLTGIMVHELFHQADHNLRRDVRASPEKQKEALDQLVKSTNLSYDQKKAIVSSFMHIYNETLQSHINQDAPPQQRIKLVADAQASTEKYILTHPERIIAEIQKRTQISPSEFELTLLSDPTRALNIIVNWQNKLENDATHYTDMFMRKHFPKEPWRGEYANFQHTKIQRAVPLLQEKACGEIKDGAYTPDTVTIASLGTLSQPIIGKEPSPFCDRKR